MPHRFLEAFPREIRDQIYTYILTSSSSPSNAVTLSPWTFEVTRSLSLLRTCKQIQRECKEIIWRHNGLYLRSPTDIFTRFSSLMEVDGLRLRRIRHMEIVLELLDKDDLEWVFSGLKALVQLACVGSGSLESITLHAIQERPRGVNEFLEEMHLMCSGEWVDGRLFAAMPDNGIETTLVFKSSWPHFSNWGKQRWLREMLLNRSDTTALLKEMHTTFGGELLIDGSLLFKDGKQVATMSKSNPRDGEIKIVPNRVSSAARSW
ncbi:hypothetical protein LOCC1_G002196 [Lachnellula occidentalis]|uniref:F-box domain-containing protein n=1 Tax=Lachnellula occidentalis TaxID=215460 RepID=A0A8H8UJF7_9HELO|nr:hypothetical protein LOCC1_G002196 [Lachnellula occidentalis]